MHGCLSSTICNSFNNLKLVVSRNEKMRQLMSLLLLGTTLVFLMSMQTHEAIRVPFPHGEEAVGLLESLRSNDPPSGSSKCTHIPVSSEGECLNEKNYAGHSMASRRPDQRLMAPGRISANRK